MAPSILVVEDDPDIRELLSFTISRAGFDLRAAETAEEALRMLDSGLPELMVIDWMLPGMDGIDLAKYLRSDSLTSAVPIIMLTARGGEIDKLKSFEAGVDDYVTKPFSPRELVARVKAILRRSSGTASAAGRPTPIDLGWDLVVDPGRREVTLAGEPVALATREFNLLHYLAEHRGLALSRLPLLDGVWGVGWVGDDRTVDVHVRQLRKKLGDALRLETVWGVGYRLD